jgi:hypothetical protein
MLESSSFHSGFASLVGGDVVIVPIEIGADRFGRDWITSR